ncbi:MAG: HEAT repeat domain-containing protein [Myxococcaceae bacterium]|nr:HEAT repeat domain-containing protein [Myxococcaceae bacterium]MCI0672559.1 HEAT repeat domain-containing protein [Myxococcaceae bacterium]
MPPLSLHAEALLRALDVTADPLASLREAAVPSREALLLELGGLGESAVIPHVVGRLVEAAPRELHAAGMALHHLLADLSSDAVRAVDAAVRGAWLHATGYRRLEPEELGRFAELSPSVLALLTCHPSGHVRAMALERLGQRSSREAWPFLLLRLNDWVEPVRRAALSEALRVLPEVPLSLLVQHLSLLTWLSRTGRADHGPFLSRVHARLSETDALSHLEAHLPELGREERRMAYRLLLEARPDASVRLLVRALADADVALRRWAAARVGERLEGEALARVLARMERSRTAFVRREAVMLYAQRVPSLAPARLQAALLDASRPVREYAQGRLARGLDAAAVYRAALRDGLRPAVALAGLGEVGAAADAALVSLFLAHPLPSVRRAAVGALGRLDGAGAAALLTGLLGDASPRVARTAAAVLQRHGARPAPQSP